MNDRGLLGPFLLFPLPKIYNPEQTNQFKVVTDPNLKKVNDVLMNKTIQVTL